MARKKQGYNARLDESLGARNRGKKTQTMKSRRDESKGTEKAMGKSTLLSLQWTKVEEPVRQMAAV